MFWKAVSFSYFRNSICQKCRRIHRSVLCASWGIQKTKKNNKKINNFVLCTDIACLFRISHDYGWCSNFCSAARWLDSFRLGTHLKVLFKCFDLIRCLMIWWFDDFRFGRQLRRGGNVLRTARTASGANCYCSVFSILKKFVETNLWRRWDIFTRRIVFIVTSRAITFSYVFVFVFLLNQYQISISTIHCF